MSWIHKFFSLLKSFIPVSTRIESISQTGFSDSKFNHYFVVTTKAKPLNSSKTICLSMNESLEDRTGRWGSFLRDFSKQTTATSLYALSLFGTQAVITPPKAHSYSLVELLQSMESRGNFDRYRDSVYLLADEGDNLSSRTDVDHPSHRDVVIGWNDAQQNGRKPGSYHIYSKDMNRDQSTSQWGDFIGSASLNSSQYVFRVDEERNSVQASESNLSKNGSDTLEDGNYVFTVIYVPDQGDFEVIGQNTNGFFYKTDSNEPLPNPSHHPSPSQTVVHVPTPTSTPTYTATPTKTKTPTLAPTTTETSTPFLTSTETPTPTPTYTLTPTPTNIPPTVTPTTTTTPTPDLDIRISGFVDAYIGDGGHTEGSPIAGSTVSLIRKVYNIEDVPGEPPLGGVETVVDANGEYDLRIPQSVAQQHPEARLRIIGTEHHDRVSPIIDVKNYAVSNQEKMDDVIPVEHNGTAYKQIFMSLADSSFNGVDIYINQRPPSDLPAVVDQSPALGTRYVPNEELQIVLDLINHEIPRSTRGGYASGNGSLINSVNEAPTKSAYIFFNDLGKYQIGGVGNIADDKDRHHTDQLDIFFSTIPRMQELLHVNYEEAKQIFTDVARQELGGLAGALRGLNNHEDSGGLPVHGSVYWNGGIDGLNSSFTHFDNNSNYINTHRGMIGTAKNKNTSFDLSVSLQKYTPQTR